MHLKDYTVKAINDVTDSVANLEKTVKVLRDKIRNKEITVEEACKELSKGTVDDSCALHTDGTLNYPYLYGRAWGAIQYIQIQISLKEV